MSSAQKPSASLPVTMQQVADTAGLSRSAVSYALRNHPSIPVPTRQRVQRIARKLGYRPDAYVSTLMARIHSRRRKAEPAALAYVVEKPVEPNLKLISFFREIREGVEARAAALGYRVELFSWNTAAMSAKRLASILHARGIRGIFFSPVDDDRPEIHFPFEGFACGTVGFSIKKPELHRASVHYQQGMDLIWEQLRSRGYRRPGLILPKLFNIRTQWSYLGTYLARQAMDSEVGAIPPCLLDGYSNFEPPIKTWFQKHRPDAVIIASTGIESVLRRLARIPEDLGLADLILEQSSGTTGIRQPTTELGATAVDMIVAQIHRNESGIPASHKTTLIKCQWVEGRTLPPKRPGQKR